MNVFTNYLEKLGSNFLVSAMIPSLALVVASMVAFEPIFHISAMFQQKNNIYQLVSFGLFLIIPTVIIGFTLTALNTYVLKFFEGYVRLPKLGYIYNQRRNLHKAKARRLVIKREALKRHIENIEKSLTTTERMQRRLKKLKSDYYSTVAEYNHSYPPSPNDILPTRFGNILKASELYPGIHYGMDGVEFWPRLIHVIAPPYRGTIDGARNELSFLVNMSVLAAIFFIFCNLAVFYTMLIAPNNPVVVFGSAIRYGVSGTIALACIFFFYNASIFSVGSFGLMIRSAYDLFRLDLLKQFRLKMPSNYAEEFRAWKNLNEFIVLGEHSRGFTQFDYDDLDVKKE